MSIWISENAINLITGGDYVSVRVKGDVDLMAKAISVQPQSALGDIWIVVPPDADSPDYTSENTTSEEKSIRETSTEGDKKPSREELVVNLLTAIMPNVEYVLIEGQLDSIIDRSKKIGAINEHLDSIDNILNKLDKTLDMEFEDLRSICK